ncbi:hypothetical protein DUI87_19712 [Hirundo rustica rustica]|uniref:Reverse transcriptase domain-containing protein n=1 Tax=Hirundo rustica rustica TaxID=333673 RepID=A0A3M0JXZ7_HIRRU|nr:hypothetical protein DUI87_19712 [Hirundo rustica rustica]
MSVRERFVHRDRMQEHHHRMRWKTLEEGIQQLREVAVLEVLFGRGGQHDNDPDKVKCTGQMLWNLATLGPSQYATYIATIHPDTNRETVSSVANKLRNYESIIGGPMQAQVSAVAKELRERMEEVTEEIREVREEMRRNSSHVAPVRVTGPRVRAEQPPARERGYTPRADLWYFLRDHGEDMGSPIWPVRKPDGEWRLTVDYRALNEVTPPLSAAVPDMLELQYELESKAAKWPQFAFTWRGVQYTWNRLPQGWKHSPTICHGLIQAALEKGEAPEHLQYIDDIIVWGNTAMEVFEKGEKIIQILLKAGFAIKQSKVKDLPERSSSWE